MKKSHKTLLLWIVLLVMFGAIYTVTDKNKALPWTHFTTLLDEVQNDQVQSLQVALHNGGTSGNFRATLRSGLKVQTDGVLSDRVLELLREHRVDVKISTSQDQPIWGFVG